MTGVSLNSRGAVSSPALRDHESALTGGRELGGGHRERAAEPGTRLRGAREDPVPCGLHFRGQGGEGGRELGQWMGELGMSISVARTEETEAGPPAPGRQPWAARPSLCSRTADKNKLLPDGISIQNFSEAICSAG